MNIIYNSDPKLKISSTLLCIAGFLCAFQFFSITGFSQNQEKIVGEIRQIYRQTNEKIEESEKNGTESETFLNELLINKNNGSYPAVGIYQVSVKFYFTYGNREKNPYPDRLLKIIVSTNRSARKEFAEFLFDPAGQLIFYFEKQDEGRENEKRIYFSAEKPVKILHGEKDINPKTRSELELVKNVLAEKKRLAGIFLNSLEF